VFVPWFDSGQDGIGSADDQPFGGARLMKTEDLAQHDDKSKRELLRGDPIAGHFWPALGGGEPVPAVLQWTSEGGGELDLVEPPQGWSAQLGGPPSTLHGVSSDNAEITLLDAWVNRMELGDRPRRFHVATIAIGSLTSADAKWTRAIYSTANLTEWRGETGLELSHPHPRKEPTLRRIEIRKPPIEKVELPRASFSLEVRVEPTAGYMATWKTDTWLDIAVNPKRRFTIDTAHREYVEPLLAFTHFASDRPDSLTREVLLDLSARTRVEVLRQGPRTQPRSWRPGDGDGYLFHSADLPDLSRAFRRWWKLHREVQPALGLFANHVEAGNMYSPGRLLNIYTALERYSKVRHGGKAEFKNLRKYGGVSTDITGATNVALSLLGASRGYFGHGETQGANPKHSADEISEHALASTRRASALLQSCLLREIGFRKAEREQLMGAYYRNWLIT
jgi:hypothetical protein